MCGKSGRCPSCGIGVKIPLPKPNKNLPDLTASLPATTQSGHKQPIIADSTNVDPPPKKAKKSLSHNRGYKVVALLNLGFGLHPIIVAILGGILGTILGVEFNLHSSAEGFAARLCNGMTAYLLVVVLTVPLMIFGFIGLALIAIATAIDESSAKSKPKKTESI
jgi:hypothetical protein